MATVLISFGFIICSYRLSLADCVYNDTKYVDQSTTCQTGHKYQCAYKTWIDMNIECQDTQSVQSFVNAECACTDDEVNVCISSGQKCTVSQESGSCIRKCAEQ